MMATTEFELGLYRLLDQVRTKLGKARDVEQAARSALRDAAGYFDAEAACLAALDPEGERARLSFNLPLDTEWDLELLAGFLERRRPQIREEIMLAPLYRRERTWRVLALKRGRSPFTHDEREAFTVG